MPDNFNRGFSAIIFIILLCVIRIYAIQSEEKGSENNCLICHRENDYMPEDFEDYDIHFVSGITCVDCHGGDSSIEDEDAMSNKFRFVGIPDKKDIPAFCGKCHSNINYMKTYKPRLATDQEQQYYTSIHGKKLLAGDLNVAECISCHTAHRILPSDNALSSTFAENVPATCNKCHGDQPLMQAYNLKTTQYEEYKLSVHGDALLNNHDRGAPACNDCHGNHGAVPPGVSSVSNVCGTCHVNNMNYFKESKMAKVFEEMNFHGCEECHGFHTVAKTSDIMIGVEEGSVCLKCHSEGDNGYDEAKKIKVAISELNQKYLLAEQKFNEVQQKGMNDLEISFLLKDAHQVIIQSRTLIHTMSANSVKQKTDEGLTTISSAIKMADEEIDEYYTRRNGFAVATILFLIFIVALYFKMKDIEKSRAERIK